MVPKDFLPNPIFFFPTQLLAYANTSWSSKESHAELGKTSQQMPAKTWQINVQDPL